MDQRSNVMELSVSISFCVMKTSFSVTTKVTPDSLKEPRSKAFEAWAVSFCEAHLAITDLEMLPKSISRPDPINYIKMAITAAAMLTAMIAQSKSAKCGWYRKRRPGAPKPRASIASANSSAN